MSTFRFIADTDKGPVRCYTGEMVMNGAVVELSDHLSGKARTNPSYEATVTIEQEPERPQLSLKDKKKASK